MLPESDPNRVNGGGRWSLDLKSKATAANKRRTTPLSSQSIIKSADINILFTPVKRWNLLWAKIINNSSQENVFSQSFRRRLMVQQGGKWIMTEMSFGRRVHYYKQEVLHEEHVITVNILWKTQLSSSDMREGSRFWHFLLIMVNSKPGKGFYLVGCMTVQPMRWMTFIWPHRSIASSTFSSTSVRVPWLRLNFSIARTFIRNLWRKYEHFHHRAQELNFVLG